MPLTKNVSMMMPSATINSKTYKSAIGIVMSAANVAAKMIPADDMTPPVLRKATLRASLMFRFFPLFSKSDSRVWYWWSSRQIPYRRQTGQVLPLDASPRASLRICLHNAAVLRGTLKRRSTNNPSPRKRQDAHDVRRLVVDFKPVCAVNCHDLIDDACRQQWNDCQ